MLNGELDCCAYGGGTTLNRDGQTRGYRATWLPPWAQNHSTVAHEMGHGFGLPHSSGPASDPPSGLQIYVSAWDVMSRSWGMCRNPDDDFGCIAPGTIGYHLDRVEWIPTSQRETVIIGDDKTFTLEQIHLPQSSANKLYARVLIGNSNQRFYSIETRRFDGYDENVPGPAVVIHDVDTQRQGNGGHALVVDSDDDNVDVNDEGAMWLPGETFVDAENDISIEVVSAGATSFTVRVINNSEPTPYPDPPTNMRTSGDANSITLEWDDNSFNELGFRIYRWNGTTFAYYAAVGANVTSFTDGGMGCSWTQYYQVTSYNDPYESERSDFVWVMGMTNPCAPELDSPADGMSVGTGPVTLRWDASWGADHYEVRLGMTAPTPIVASDVYGTSYTAAGLATGQFYWQVRAVNAQGGVSEWSDEWTFATVSPLNAVPELHFFDTVMLTWNRVSWATGYHVQVARDAGFNDVVYDNAALPASALSVSPTLDDGRYYWRVRALGGDWSVPQRFTKGG
jgi:hypothetical protein